MARRERSHFNTAEVAEVIGVSKRTILNWLKRGFITEPERNPANRYRVWHENDVIEIQQRIRERNSDKAGYL